MSLAFRMATRSVMDNWRHSLATLTSIAAGFCGVALVQGYMLECDLQFTRMYEDKSMFGHILVEAEPKADEAVNLEGLTMQKTLDAIQGNAKDIEELVRFMPIEGIITGPNNALNYFGYAYDVGPGRKMRGERWAWDTLYGEPLKEGDSFKVLVSRGLAELLGCDFAGKDIQYLSDGRFVPNRTHLDCFDDSMQLSGLTVKGKINAWDAKISGIIDAGLREWDDKWLLMPIQDSTIFYGGLQLSMVGIKLKDPSQAESFAKRLNSALREKGLKVKAKPWKEHKLAELYLSNMVMLDVLRKFILIIVLLVCTLSMVSTIARNIVARTRETGSLRAIGYEQSFVVRLFGLEGFVLGIVGSLLGAVATAILAFLINGAEILYFTPFSTAPVPVRVEMAAWIYLALTCILSIAAGIIATLVAKFRSDQSIAEALSS